MPVSVDAVSRPRRRRTVGDVDDRAAAAPPLSPNIRNGQDEKLRAGMLGGMAIVGGDEGEVKSNKIIFVSMIAEVDLAKTAGSTMCPLS